jgi:lysozyme family protein
MPTFEASAAGYRALWKSMRVTRGPQCERAARRILAGRSQYLAVERITGVPWFFVGLLHMRESGCNFAGVLHNGEPIIGTGRKTKLVPRGRGPFHTWQEAAIDAMRLKGLHRIKEWPIERLGFEAERYNGWGYLGKVNSPYVWAGSQHYTRGKYIADHVWSATHVDQQLGVMPMLDALCRADAEVAKRVRGHAVAVTTSTGVGGAVVAVGVQQGWGAAEWLMAAVCLGVVAGIAYLVIARRRAKRAANLPPLLNDTSISLPDRGGAAEDIPT